MFDYDKQDGTIWIYDEIAEDGYGGVSSGDVVKAIKAIGDEPLTVRINSPGGSVFEGLAIYNALIDHRAPVTTSNDSLAASIASVVFLAGNTRKAAPNSFLMIHEPFSGAMGTAAGLRKQADLLDQAGETLLNIYEDRTNYSRATVQNLMSLETWFNADEQIANSLATDTTRQVAIEPAPVAKARFKNAPAALIKDLEPGSRTQHFLKLAALENRLKVLQSRNR